MKRLFLRLAPLALLLACQAPTTPISSPSPQVSPFPQTTPSPQISASPETGSRPPFTPGPEYNISSDSGQTFGDEWKTSCDFGFQTRTDNLGGLTPKLPLAICNRAAANRGVPYNSDWIKPQSSFFLGVIQTIYLLKQGEAVKQLETVSQVKDTFVPIESSEEALSFLLATTSRVEVLTANALPEASSPTYKVQSLEGTRVEKQGENYLVKNVMQNGSCLADGRDVKALSTDFLVHRSGETEVQKQTEIYTYGPCPIE